MALGSSAPEILLSVIEIMSSGFYAGELGPSTIVGSAAFNMLIISAVCVGHSARRLRPFDNRARSVQAHPPTRVGSGRRLRAHAQSLCDLPLVCRCVVAIPDGGSRTIKELPVFYITAAFSLFAYIWLIVILTVHTPNFVDIWEALVTFLMFPLLVYVAYLADISDDVEERADDSPEAAQAAQAIGYGRDGRAISRMDVTRVLALKTVETLSGEEQLQAVASLLLPPQSKAYYRQAATKFAMGVAQPPRNDAAQLRAQLMASEMESAAGTSAVVEWAQAARTCREAQSHVELALTRGGNLSKPVSVHYASESGTATEGVDFEAARGVVNFAAGQRVASMHVAIIDDDEEEDDEVFYVKLFRPSIGCVIGTTPVCTVTIQDDDGPGELSFDSRELEVFESAGSVKVTVHRTHGCEGTIGCQWATRDGTAKSPSGYIGASGSLVFAEGVTQKTLQVELVDLAAYHRDDDFQIVLTSASGGGRLVTDYTTRTRRATVACVVNIQSDQMRRQKVDELVQLLDFSASPPLSLETDSWCDQYGDALEMPSDGSSVSLVLHVLALPWKLISATIPPPSYGGGWLCFGVTLAVSAHPTAHPTPCTRAEPLAGPSTAASPSGALAHRHSQHLGLVAHPSAGHRLAHRFHWRPCDPHGMLHGLGALCHSNHVCRLGHLSA